jgi:glycosyltransferase involved in cell wall biosynthesis
MRLTILSRDLPPHVGGIADHTANLAHWLARAGDTVTIVTRQGADEVEGCTVWTHEAFDTMPPHALVNAVLASEPEVVLWAYNPFSFGKKGLAFRAERIAGELARASQVRRVLFAHELAYPGRTNGFTGAVWSLSQNHALKRVLSSVDEVIVTTPDRVAQMHERGVTAHEIPVGSNLPDLGPTVVRADPTPFVLCHMGGVGPGRDLETMLTAMRALPDDVRMLLLGDTGPFDQPDDLATRLEAPGRAEIDDLATQLHAADLYVHLDPVGPTPGRRTTLVAAMQAGMPIVAFEGEQTDDRMRTAARLVPVGEPTALAAAIGELRRDPAERERLGQAARELYEQVFSWPRITERVRSVCTGE